MQCICLICETSFNKPPSDIKKGKGKYCSNICVSEARSRITDHPCVFCGKIYLASFYYVTRGQGLHCSLSCYDLSYRQSHVEQRQRTSRTYAVQHAEEIRIKKAAIHMANREEELARMAKWRADHPEERRAYEIAHKEDVRIYRLEHRDEIRLRRAAYYQANREKIIARVHAWYIENPTKTLEQVQRRRARKANAPINDFTKEQWIVLQEIFNHRCAYCGKRAKGKLTRDHITPLSKSGPNTLWNIVPSCRSCNSKKGVGKPIAPVQPLLFAV